MMDPARRWAEFRIAMMLLTRLPMGEISGDVPGIAAARWAYPLCGAVIGLIGWAALMLGHWLGLPSLPAALLALAAMILVTGGLHEDGLADFADGIGSGAGRERALEIMRDSRIGSYGTLALILVIALNAAALSGLVQEGALLAGFLAVSALSRTVMSLALALMPPARQDGLGHRAGEDGADGPALPLGLGALATLPLLILAPLAACVLIGVTALTALVVARLAQRRIGGQTGDVLGAMQQLTQCAGWLTLAALG